MSSLEQSRGSKRRTTTNLPTITIGNGRLPPSCQAEEGFEDEGLDADSGGGLLSPGGGGIRGGAGDEGGMEETGSFGRAMLGRVDNQDPESIAFFQVLYMEKLLSFIPQYGGARLERNLDVMYVLIGHSWRNQPFRLGLSTSKAPLTRRAKACRHKGSGKGYYCGGEQPA